MSYDREDNRTSDCHCPSTVSRETSTVPIHYRLRYGTLYLLPFGVAGGLRNGADSRRRRQRWSVEGRVSPTRDEGCMGSECASYSTKHVSLLPILAKLEAIQRWSAICRV